MPTPRTQPPDIVAFEKLLRFLRADSKNASWSQVEIPVYLKALMRHHAPVDWQKRGSVRAAFLGVILSALADLFKTASLEAIPALLSIWVYYVVPLYFGAEHVEYVDLEPGMKSDELADEIAQTLKLPEKRNIQQAQQRIGILGHETISNLKNDGLTLWVERLEQTHRALAHRLAEQLPILNADYVPREQFQRQLDELVTSEARGLVALTGKHGAGKTLLALAWARQQAEALTFSDGIYFIRAGYFADRQHWLGNVLKSDTKRALVVIDNPLDEQTVEWLASLTETRSLIVVTTRMETWLRGRCAARRILRLTRLEPEEGWALLAGHYEPDETDAVERVANLLAWDPQALAILRPLGVSMGWESVLKRLRANLYSPLQISESKLDEHSLRALDFSYEQMNLDQHQVCHALARVGLVSSFNEQAAQFVTGQTENQVHRVLADLVQMNILQVMSESEFPGHRFQMHWNVWRYFEYKNGNKAHINFEHYPDLCYSPKIWWKATLPGQETLLQALGDPMSWAAPAQAAPGKSLFERVFTLRYADVLNNYVLRNSVILPFEVLATARSLQVRSARLISIWQALWLVLVSMIVMAISQAFGQGALVSLAMLFLVNLLLGWLIFAPHLLNYYRFLKRHMG
jgi:hypothetical protein